MTQDDNITKVSTAAEASNASPATSTNNANQTEVFFEVETPKTDDVKNTIWKTHYEMRFF